MLPTNTCPHESTTLGGNTALDGALGRISDTPGSRMRLDMEGLGAGKAGPFSKS